MISRRGVLEDCTVDEMSVLIRCALQERVSGALPSSQTWERIVERAERRMVLKRITESLGLFLRAVDVWLLADTFSPASTIRPARHGRFATDRATLWGYDLGWSGVLDQYHVVARPVFWSPNV